MARWLLMVALAAPAVAHAAGDRDGARPEVGVMRYDLACAGNAVHTLQMLVADGHAVDPNAVGELAEELGRQLDALRAHDAQLPALAANDAAVVDRLNTLRARIDLLDADLRELVALERAGNDALRVSSQKLDLDLKKATDALAAVNADFGLPKLLRM